MGLFHGYPKERKKKLKQKHGVIEIMFILLGTKSWVSTLFIRNQKETKKTSRERERERGKRRQLKQ